MYISNRGKHDGTISSNGFLSLSKYKWKFLLIYLRAIRLPWNSLKVLADLSLLRIIP